MQAIGALLDNADQFSPNGGHIRIAAEVQTSALSLSITDPGVGIPADEVYHIFDRLRHLETARDHLYFSVISVSAGV